MIDFTWYDDDGGAHGVLNVGGESIWWGSPDAPPGRFGEVARDQTQKYFRASGPPPPISAEIEEQLCAALNAVEAHD